MSDTKTIETTSDAIEQRRAAAAEAAYILEAVRK
jgi:hypothetical protein